MKKLQQYYIFKIATTRLKNSNYKIDLSIKDARRYGEIVSMGDSQMFRSLRNIKGINIDEQNIQELFLERKRIKRKKSSEENLKRLIEIDQKIDDYLFIPEIISIFVEDKNHYKKIGKDGFILNNKKYVRFACGAGHARRNNVLFIDEEYADQIDIVLNNGREDIEITPAKYNAYFALSTSASLPVSEPYFCVVPDKEVVRTEKVDFVKEIENGDDEVIEMDRDITFNLWDGQGIISPKMAKQWAEELELDYIPSSFIIRSNFIKGLVVVIDFHKFSDEIGKRFITDIYGNTVNIRDMDVILTQSQFKLWNAFSSISEYKKKSESNNLQWSITRVAPKYDPKHTFLNYQFIQALNLSDQSIENITKKTFEYFDKVTQKDVRYTLLYLLGKVSDGDYEQNIFNKINDKITKAIILNNKILDDPYIKTYLVHSLNKKIKESYIGNLIVDGSYSIMVSDPYAFLEYIFDLPINGLLNREEHYNKYWINKGEKQLAGMRAPLTWRSEVNILNLKNNERISEWFQYLNSCVVYNVFGNDTLLHADSDWDGDILCITNNKDIINSAYGGNPITYENKKSPKVKIKKHKLYLADLNGFNTKVGFVTNVATTAFGMLPMFKEGSKEHNELIKRLKCLRKEQGSTIDATKGLEIKPFPMRWTKWNKINEDDSDETKEHKLFLNKIKINKRSYFMRYVYSHYNRRYLNNLEKWNRNSRRNFGKSLDQIIENNKNGIVTTDEKYLLDQYYKYSDFIESDSIMNKICFFMERKIKLMKTSLNKTISNEQILLLKNKNIVTDSIKYKKLYDLYKKYKSEKRNFAKIKDLDDNYKFKTIEQFNKYIRQEANYISSNGSELANMAVDICYITHKNDNKTFLWNVFGEDLLENLYLNKQENIYVPFIDKNGDIEYLGNYYKMKKIKVEVENIYDGEDFYECYS